LYLTCYLSADRSLIFIRNLSALVCLWPAAKADGAEAEMEPSPPEAQGQSVHTSKRQRPAGSGWRLAETRQPTQPPILAESERPVVGLSRRADRYPAQPKRMTTRQAAGKHPVGGTKTKAAERQRPGGSKKRGDASSAEASGQSRDGLASSFTGKRRQEDHHQKRK
jgi:hypothetical protein